jgi:hypothetical protein
MKSRRQHLNGFKHTCYDQVVQVSGDWLAGTQALEFLRYGKLGEPKVLANRRKLLEVSAPAASGADMAKLGLILHF